MQARRLKGPSLPAEVYLPIFFHWGLTPWLWSMYVCLDQSKKCDCTDFSQILRRFGRKKCPNEPKNEKKSQRAKNACFLISTVRKLSCYVELWTGKQTRPNSATRFGKQLLKCHKKCYQKWQIVTKVGKWVPWFFCANSSPSKKIFFGSQIPI